MLQKTQKRTHLAVLKRANGSCRAVSEFDVKHGDVSAAAQCAAGQSVTLPLLQRRHPASSPPPARLPVCLVPVQNHTNPAEINKH